MCVSSVRNPHDQNKEADLDSRRVLEELDEEGDVLESLLGDRDKEKPEASGALQMIKNAAEFLIGPTEVKKGLSDGQTKKEHRS